MNSVIRISSAILLVFCCASNAEATGFAGIGMGFGGDNLVTRNDGKEMTAGGGYYVEMGIDNDKPYKAITYRISFGIKRDTLNAGGESASISSKQVHIMRFGKSGPNRFGIGLALHFDPVYKLSLAPDNAEFSDATGLALEWNFILPHQFYIATRYTSITYKGVRLVDQGGNVTNSVNASSFSFAFGRAF